MSAPQTVEVCNVKHKDVNRRIDTLEEFKDKTYRTDLGEVYDRIEKLTNRPSRLDSSLLAISLLIIGWLLKGYF